MAGRDKKTKKLSNASRESPISNNSKQPSILSYMSPTPQDSEREMNQEPSTSGAKKVIKPGSKTKKLNPASKINTLRGRNKTKANFKLIQTLAQQAIKPVMRRGRPPLKKQIKTDSSPEKSEDSISTDDTMAKKRGRKKNTPPADSTEDVKTEGSEAAKPVGVKEVENKKTVIKNAPKKVVKKKQLLVTQKGLTKRKVLLSKKILKSDAKQVDPKVLKKNLTAKLKSVTEKLEAKKSVSEKDSLKESNDASELIPASDIKKEPGLCETPLVPDSRSSSPRTGTRKRNTADISISKAALNDIPSSPGVKSPYSTRSERSSPLTLTPNDQSPKVLRNGRQRKPKGLKTTLLSETVDQEHNKRRRLLSDTKLELCGEFLEVDNKIKRFRSCSRDGSEISKCSDVTESDLSTCDGASIDMVDSKKTQSSLPVAKIKEERISIDTSPNAVTRASNNSNDLSSKAEDSNAVTSPVGAQSRESVDNDNNNTDDKIKTDGQLCDKLIGKLDEADANAIEKSVEKSLILDNMSKAFNEYVPNKKGNIRRSARQRKSTVKAKEQEETMLAEQLALEPESDVDKAKNDSTDKCDSSPESADIPKVDVPDLGIISETPIAEQLAPKITTKTFYGDSKRLSLETKIIYKNDVEKEPVQTLSVTVSEDIIVKPVEDDGADAIRLHIDEDEETENGLVDDTLKENIECSIAPKQSDPQDIGKLMNKLRHFEEQDKKKQEEKQQSVMVTNDVVLISKNNVTQSSLKDSPNALGSDKPKEKENIMTCLENNSAISIVKKEQIRKSFEIDLPSSVTLIKKTATTARKHSTSSRDGDSVTVLDKSLGKDLTLELRKSIDKGILSLESSSNVKTSTINTGNGQSLSISLKPQTPKDLVVIPITTTSSIPVASVTAVVSNSVTALISLPTPSPLMITPIPLSNNIPVPMTSATVVPKALENQTHILTIEPSNAVATEPTLIIEDGAIAAKEPVSQTLTITPKSLIIPPISLPSGISIISSVVSTLPKLNETTPSSNDTVSNKKDVEDEVQTLVNSESKENIEIPSLVKSPPPTEKQVPTGVVVVPDSPVSQKHKKDVLRALGLISLQEADEAKLEKEKQKEIIKSKPDGYTGTLKTVIKLNRTGLEKKPRIPLKMTLQKNKSRTSKVAMEGLSADSESDESPYYTIHKEISGAGYGAGPTENHVSSGGHRKTHYSNRFNNHDNIPTDPLADTVSDANAPKEATKNLVIPEKASSFGIHPGRLCQDQCFYCGGKFGLFDTPCHVAQIKSADRQKKILDNEEKLTVDSCLCDACYRHVDRRANCPGYRRKVGGGGGILGGPVGALIATGVEGDVADGALCHATMCRKPAPHTLRRKWLVKMRNSISKVVQLDLDYPGLHTIPLCDMHYQAISPLMVCELCKTDLPKNHGHYLNQEYKTLNPLLAELGLPVEFKEKPTVCKMCRYFCSLLCKLPLPQGTKKSFFKTYKRRLFLAYNVDLPEESENEEGEDTLVFESNSRDIMGDIKEKKKNKNGKSKSKKSGEIPKSTDENHSRDTTSPLEGSQENKKALDDQGNNKQGVLEEDIESLISTNTIPIPNPNSNKTSSNNSQSDGNAAHKGQPASEISDNSDLEMMTDLDPAELLKQSELQMLLQKCNIPSSTILQKGPITNLTQKNRNILKVHNATAINKNIVNQKIMDKNARRIQKLGQIITKSSDLEKAICSRLPNREEFTLEAAEKAAAKDMSGISILKNLALNDECTIESLPAKPASKQSVDINTLKNKLQLSNSYSQIKKNLKALSQNSSKKPKSDGSLSDNLSNPVKRLETNPSISVRELFPGEEEMNLQCSIEFGNIKGITPDGWEKCSSTIQYDAETKRLWHELQKPYGNQSSFLRHLILLEKYFRNGDLILSQNANYSAITYSDSVQNRLRSYDNIPTGDTVQLPVVKPTMPAAPTVDVLAGDTAKTSQTSSLIDFRKQKTNISGKSLLKTNQQPSGLDHINSFPHMKNPAVVRPIESLLPTAFNHAKIPKNVPISLAQINQSLDPGFNKADKNMLLSLSQLENFNSHLVPQMPIRPDFHKPAEIKVPNLPPSINIEAKPAAPKSDSMTTKPKAPSLPPELIAINTDTQLQRKSIENVLKNIQQLVKASSTPISKPFTPQVEQTPGLSPIATSTPPSAHTAKSSDVPVSSASNPAGVTIVSDQSKKSKPPKQWRPTLIPITEESKSRVAKEVLYQTADGRRLPSLVQVMSGGKPYHITIQDYNKMCIMRREKLQQLQKAEMSKKPSGSATPASVYDFTLDPPIIPASVSPSSVTTMTKAPSPPPYSISTETTHLTISPASLSTKQSDLPATETSPANSNKSLTPVKASDSQLEIAPNSGMEITAVSLLKNVGLKNITIAPITSTSSNNLDIKPVKSTSSSPPASSVVIPSVSATPSQVVSLPSLISHLGPSVSVTTETGTKINTSSNSNTSTTATQLVSCVQPISITSQTVLLPKMPKSLTVIPQTVTTPQITQTQQQQSPQEP